MLGLGLGINKNIQSGGFDSSYKAILNYATANAITLPSDARQIVENQLILDMKSIGLWDRLELFYMFRGAPNDEYSKINWKNPSSFYLTETNSPTWNTATGWTTISASGSYLEAPWNSNTNRTISSSSSISVGSYIVGGTDGIITATSSGETRILASPTFSYYRLYTTISTISNSVATTYPEHIVASRTGTAFNAYKAGVSYLSGVMSGEIYSSFNLRLGYFTSAGDVSLGYFFLASAVDDIVSNLNTTLSNYITAL